MNMLQLEGQATPFVLMRHPGLANTIIAQLPQGIAVIDVQQQHLPLTFCNTRFLELTGLGTDAVIGKNFPQLLSLLTDAEVSADCRQRLLGRESFEAELRIKRRSNDALRVHVHFMPLADGDQVAYMLAAVHDITLEYCAQQALRDSAALYQALVASLAEGVVVQDERGRIIACNQAAEALLGPLPEAGILENLVAFQHEDGRPCPAEELPMRVTLRTGRPLHDMILSVQTQNGPRRWLSVHTQPLCHPDHTGTRAVVSSYIEITQRKQAEEWAHHLAFHDELTGLPNRRLLEDRARQCLERATRNHRQFALLFLDLDNFKELNDSYGHHAGDIVLKGVAERLRSVVRAEDSLCRCGGDEFVILLEDFNSADDIPLIAEKVRLSLAAPLCIDERHLVASISIGASLFPRDGRTLDELIAAADAAMYRAKREGRNACLFVQEAPTLLDAADKPCLCFQPEIDLTSGTLTGLDTGIRQNGSDSSLIKARNSDGGQVPLCQWLLEAACLCHQHWSAAGLVPPPLSVNLANLRVDECLLEMVAGILEKTGMNPDALTLAFQEEAVMRENRRTAETLEVLATMGITLAIKNFGAGFTSINYLRHAPFRQLRIGKTFVNKISANTNDHAAVSGIIDLAHHLGLQVIAEGVEMDAQAQALRQLGCDAAQGYLISPPLSAQGVEELISLRRPFSVDAF